MRRGPTSPRDAYAWTALDTFRAACSTFLHILAYSHLTGPNLPNTLSVNGDRLNRKADVYVDGHRVYVADVQFSTDGKALYLSGPTTILRRVDPATVTDGHGRPIRP